MSHDHDAPPWAQTSLPDVAGNDDDDDAPLAPPSGGLLDSTDMDADPDDAAQDFRLFAASLPGANKSGGGAKGGRKATKAQASGKALRRGEKDFETHGTRAQVNVLEESRGAMHEVLRYTRTHRPKDVLRGWYFPELWSNLREEDEREESKRTGMFGRERVVGLEQDKGLLVTQLGRAMTGAGVEKDVPGALRTWLLPEEALYLVERGSMDLWWPARGAEDVFPVPDGNKKGDGTEDEKQRKESEDYELGVPLSLQAAYALFIGKDGERGKISLEKYQVYSHLRRTGYKVHRAVPMSAVESASSSLIKAPHQSLWQWLLSFLHKDSSSAHTPPIITRPFGPLVQPGLYRSYVPVFDQLYLIQRHKPTPKHDTPPHSSPEDPFRIFFHAWSSASVFPKTKPIAPDFRIAVVDARTSSVPTLEQLSALLESTPFDPPETKEGHSSDGFMYKRLKHGWRNALVAVVDGGLISYLRLGEMAFGEERLFERTGRGGRKGGNRGRTRGRGGRGRGRGG
ncbi:hypothetical protein F5Y15DRAFT_150976 [Xylariaceae sp. FL0016]|nr:hypothetical protein F5Y15DRAFT_150976 [Xylariaceae sp. FL0016]